MLRYWVLVPSWTHRECGAEDQTEDLTDLLPVDRDGLARIHALSVPDRCGASVLASFATS